MTTAEKTIGQKIKEIRETRHYSQEAIAKALDISVTSYAKIERDEVEITVKRLEEIAKALKVNTWAFFSPESAVVIIGDVGDYSNVHNPNSNIAINYAFNPEREAHLMHIKTLEKQVESLQKMVDKLLPK
ncbi:MAG: XRE family transcriptional regulator [Bacteroidetes bacterium]|nr:MAG: XRE family transcriptional regulator [Bacteroidota bacterium]